MITKYKKIDSEEKLKICAHYNENPDKLHNSIKVQNINPIAYLMIGKVL